MSRCAQRSLRVKRARKQAAVTLPAGPSADVRHVGEIRAQLLLVVLPQRHLPDAVPGVVARGA